MFVTAVFRRLTCPIPRHPALVAAASAALAGVVHADTFTVTKSADSVIDTRGMVLASSASYGIGINGNSFTNSAITTYNGWQYTAYWARTGTTAASTYVAVARRPVGTTSWQVANLTGSTFSNGFNSNDAHNVVSLGIDETNGTLHLSYDHHNSTLKYRVSNAGIATNPGSYSAAQWSQSLFQSERNWLVNSGSAIGDVTYPHFIRKNNGGLQLTYRTGSSGNGSNWIADYSGTTGAWSNVHQYDNGAVGTYYGTVTNGDSNRNSYINGATYGPSGRLYQSFTWREGATGAANHDIAFVYSDDSGNTWRNNAGTVVGNAATGQKFSLNSPGLTAVPIDESQSLMNQQAQAVSGNSAATERFHTLMWHRDTAKTTSTATWAPGESSYFHYWRDTDGTFHRSRIPTPVGSRPKIFFDANDNAYAIFQYGSISSGGIYINNGDLTIAAATKASNWNDWKVIRREGIGTFVSEAQADLRLFALNGTLSVLMQNSPSGSTSSPTATSMRALDFTFNIAPAVTAAAAADGVWGAPATWGGTVPTSNANAVINAGRSVNQTGGTHGLLGNVVVGQGGTAGTLVVSQTPGNGITELNIGGSVIVGRDGYSPGTYTQTGGTLAAARIAVGEYTFATDGTAPATPSPSTATVSGGKVTVDELQIAMGRGTQGSSFTTAGTGQVNVNGEILVGDLGNSATLNLTGGTTTVAGDIREGLSGSNSTVSLNGGTLDMTGNSVFADTVQLNSGRIQNVKSINNAPINKTNEGVLALAGSNTFTQAVTVSAGAIRAESNTALGTASSPTTVVGGTTTGQLQLANNITVAEPIILGGRQPVGAAADAPHINNVAGTNTLAGPIATTSGGNQYNVNSDAGKLIVAGNFVNTATGGATDVRTLKVGGAGDGEWRSDLKNAAGNAAVTALTKTGAGTWTLSGVNTYTGPTTIADGTLRMGRIDGMAVANYDFDAGSGTTVVNTGTGGTAMNGVLDTGATIVANGRFGKAASFNGSGSVTVYNSVADLGPSAVWTVSAWAKTATAGGAILGKNQSGWTNGSTVYYLGDGTAGGSGGVPSAVRHSGGFFQGAAGSANVADNAWHLVTYVNNAGSYAIYVDGVAIPLSAGNAGFGNADTGMTMRIGATVDNVAGDGTLNFNGLLDNVQVYATALSAAQVAGLYGGGYGTLPSATRLSIADGGTLDVDGTIQQVASLNGTAGSAVSLGAGRLVVNTADNDVFAGMVSGSGGSLAKTGNGTLTLTGPNTYTGGTVVNGGTLRVTSAAAGTTAATPLLTSTGGVDLQNGRIVFDYSGDTSPAETIRGLLATAHASDFATGQLRSSTATAARGLGYRDDGTTVTVMATLYGDVDLDGGVSINDFNALAANFGTASATWTAGDFDYDGGVSINDFNLLAANFGQSLAGGAAAVDYSGLLAFAAAHNDLVAFEAVTGVPEPTTFGLIGAATTLALRRRRRAC